MSKLSYEDKINIYNEKKEGISIGRLSSKYKVRKCVINYLTALIDKHGYDILRTRQNKVHTIFEKQEAIDRVLISGESVWSVAIDLGLLSYGMLQNWIKKYKARAEKPYTDYYYDTETGRTYVTSDNGLVYQCAVTPEVVLDEVTKEYAKIRK